MHIYAFISDMDELYFFCDSLSEYALGIVLSLYIFCYIGLHYIESRQM